MSAVPLLLLLDDVDELLLDVDESLPSSSSTGGRAPPRRTVTGFGAAFRASRGDRRGLCCGCLLMAALFYVLGQCMAGRRRLRECVVGLPLFFRAVASRAEQGLPTWMS